MRACWFAGSGGDIQKFAAAKFIFLGLHPVKRAGARNRDLEPARRPFQGPPNASESPMLEPRLQETHMVADSNSQIAWHRAQIRKHRDTLKQFETARFTFGEIAGPTATEQMQEIVAELQRKIRDSEQIVAAYERQSRRPLTTDFQTLANVPWGKWNDRGPSSAR